MEKSQQPYVLTGIKPTGILHLGNYVGAIKPIIELANSSDFAGSFVFIADYHALNGLKDPKLLRSYVLNIARVYLALGLDTNKTYFYKQSDIQEIFELQTILNPFTPKGLMNRAHAYKAILEKDGNDNNVNMGLYTYPILMAADVLLFSINKNMLVPVGKDQTQHIEMMRDIAGYFNNNYKTNIFALPNGFTQNNIELPGIDGRKMSKSYGNIIPIFEDPKTIKKIVMGIKTDSRLPNEIKPDFEDNYIYKIYKIFASKEEVATFGDNLRDGKMGYGDAKKILADKSIEYFKVFFEKYNYYCNVPDKEIEDLLQSGAEKVRSIAAQNLNKVKSIIGM